MIKAVLSGSFDFGGVACMDLARLHSRGIDSSWMTKRAAVLTREMDDLRPEKGRAYIHLIALGDMESFGMNRNGDGFPKQANIDYHHTFVTDGHVYKHHQNKDPRRASGEVKASAYNPDGRRVELIIGVDEEKWAPELTKLANGELPSVSMACRVPFDICSSCNNHARSRSEYCDHLKYHMTKLSADGTQIGAINTQPTFFDISSVMRNADRIAFGLRKVAAEAQPMSGVELADALGIGAPPLLFERSSRPSTAAKAAALSRLASLEKEIEGVLGGKIDHRGIKRVLPAAVAVEPLTDKEAQVLHAADPRTVFGELAKEAVCLPIEDFYRVVFGSEYGSVADQVKQAREQLPGIFSKLAEDSEKAVEDGSYEPRGGAVPPAARSIINQLVRRLSTRKGPAVARITVVTMRKIPLETVESAPTKSAGAEADFLASEYAKYKLAFVHAADAVNNDGILVLTALQNYVK